MTKSRDDGKKNDIKSFALFRGLCQFSGCLFFDWLIIVITKSNKLTTHNTASKNRERKAISRAPNAIVQNTAKINRNTAPPLYKINRPNFFKYKCPSRELALIQVLKGIFIHALNLRPFWMCLPICLQFVVR